MGAWSIDFDFTPLQLAAKCRGAKLWGKTVYHAKLAPGEAAKLQGMPTVILKYRKDIAPESAVSYSGPKSGFYTYFFPPIVYKDGNIYVKIGHSPHDPAIESLGTKNESNASKLEMDAQ